MNDPDLGNRRGNSNGNSNEARENGQRNEILRRRIARLEGTIQNQDDEIVSLRISINDTMLQLMSRLDSVLESGPAGTAADRLSSERHSDPADTGHIDRSGYSLRTAYILWITLGWFGAHHLYLRRDRQAFVWFCTFGGCLGVGWFTDLFHMKEYVQSANHHLRYSTRTHPNIHHASQSYFLIRFFGKLLFGSTLGTLVVASLLEDSLSEQPWLGRILVTTAVSLGVHTVANIGEAESKFLASFLPASTALAMYSFLRDIDVTILLLVASTLSSVYTSLAGTSRRKFPDNHWPTSTRIGILSTCYVAYAVLVMLAISNQYGKTVRVFGVEFSVGHVVHCFEDTFSWVTNNLWLLLQQLWSDITHISINRGGIWNVLKVSFVLFVCWRLHRWTVTTDRRTRRVIIRRWAEFFAIMLLPSLAVYINVFKPTVSVGNRQVPVCEARWNFNSVVRTLLGFLCSKHPSDISEVRSPNKIDLWLRSLRTVELLCVLIIALNVVVFLMWRVQSLKTFMDTYFTDSPFSVAPWRSMVLSSFSHYSAFHLYANMSCLWSMAPGLDRILSWTQFLIVYLAAAIASGLTSYAFKVWKRRFSPSLGASGAIMAFVSITCLVYPDSRFSFIYVSNSSLPATDWLALMVIVDSFGVIVGWSKIDHAAHLGGMFFGMFYARYGHELIWRAPLMKHH